MSSVGESTHTDGVTSDRPMLSPRVDEKSESESYSHRSGSYARRKKIKWTVFVSLVVIVLILLVCGAIGLIATSTQEKIIPKPEVEELHDPVKQKLRQKEKLTEFIFEYEGGDNQKEKVIVNVKQNYTELSARDITVLNYFRKRISLHRLDISPGVRICLIKVMEDEVKPRELTNALSHITSIEVNSTELFVIDDTPVPDKITDDMTIAQFCQGHDTYSLKRADDSDPDGGMTMEELIESAQANTRLYKRQATPDGAPYHCGGRFGGGESLPAHKYTCTKKKSYCYRSLVSERCDKCYHGNNIWTTGCWCPIKAIQMCIKITYKPDKRFCCGMDNPPCVKSECGTRRVPFVPIPVITVKISTNTDE